MIGKFIVYESIFRDRFVCRKVVGETKGFWEVENIPRHEFDESEKRRKKKDSLDIISVHDEFEQAKHTANALTGRFHVMNERHQKERRETIDAYRTANEARTAKPE